MGADHRLKKLCEPLQVKQVTLRNRIVKPAQVLGFAADDGNAGPTLIDHYETIAKGGVGLLIVESTCVDYPIGGKGQNRLRIDHPRSRVSDLPATKPQRACREVFRPATLGGLGPCGRGNSHIRSKGQVRSAPRNDPCRHRARR